MPCSISGEVVRGNRIGRQLGFPTANLRLEEAGAVVEDGVYAVCARVDGVWRNGVANAGSRPTITDDPERFLEINLFDFEGDLYGRVLEVELIAFLRPERRFDSPEVLRRQIEQDKREAGQRLENWRNAK